MSAVSTNPRPLPYDTPEQDGADSESGDAENPSAEMTYGSDDSDD